MNFKVIPTEILGCFEIEFTRLNDIRGNFTKTFNVNLYKQLGIEMHVDEEYFTYPVKNVFRGLHFQIPPKTIDKIVYCVMGQVNDYVVDLRKDSPTYGKYLCFELDGEKPKALFVPVGLAHGFYVKSENALMQYKVSRGFDKDCDTGISYTSFDFAKDIVNPILSDRDKQFISFEQFETPF